MPVRCTRCGQRFPDIHSFEDHHCSGRDRQPPRPIADGGLETCAVCSFPIHGSPYRRNDTTYHQSCRPDVMPDFIKRNMVYSTTQQEVQND